VVERERLVQLRAGRRPHRELSGQRPHVTLGGGHVVGQARGRRRRPRRQVVRAAGDEVAGVHRAEAEAEQDDRDRRHGHDRPRNLRAQRHGGAAGEGGAEQRPHSGGDEQQLRQRGAERAVHELLGDEEPRIEAGGRRGHEP